MEITISISSIKVSLNLDMKNQCREQTVGKVSIKMCSSSNSSSNNNNNNSMDLNKKRMRTQIAKRWNRIWAKRKRNSLYFQKDGLSLLILLAEGHIITMPRKTSQPGNVRFHPLRKAMKRINQMEMHKEM